MTQITEEIRAKAEIYHGDQICQEKKKELLKEIGLPNGILPLFEGIIEAGFVRETGFLWLKLQKPKIHKYKKIGRLSSFATEITAFVDRFKVTKATGLKTKEMFVWIAVSEACLDPKTEKITFKSPYGLCKTFPASVFEVDDDETSMEVDNNQVNQEAVKSEN